MSQAQTRSRAAILQPVRFSAAIQLLDRPRLIGEWIIARPAENERDEPVLNEYQFSGVEPESVARLQDSFQAERTAADAMQFLRREGAFRNECWKKIGIVLSSGVPAEVKDGVRAFRLSKDDSVYVERVDDLQKRLKLFGHLAKLGGALRSGRYGEAKTHIDHSRQLLESIDWANTLPAASGKEGNGIFSMFEIEPPAKAPVRPPKIQLPKPRVGARQQLFAEANGVIDTAFRRGLGKLTVAYRRWNTEEPGLLIQTQAAQATLYLCLLTFNRDWRECKRPDCRKFFPTGHRKEKVYCSNYCAHLQDMRRRRNEERRLKAQRKRRSQPRS